jgi:lactobin A/cerein 7B family class IIb bacteriocin
MNSKFNSVAFEPLSQADLMEVKGGFAYLVVALVVFDIVVVGMAVSGAFQMGYDKGVAEVKAQKS